MKIEKTIQTTAAFIYIKIVAPVQSDIAAASHRKVEVDE
ncbi:DUF3284 domain-containing protein, partial [Lactobacillus rhamnosus]|nr:DUF3284 domain-containing protein [Lacticaseibacillus rhamnosus]